jgi:hypothetical protein
MPQLQLFHQRNTARDVLIEGRMRVTVADFSLDPRRETVVRELAVRGMSVTVTDSVGVSIDGTANAKLQLFQEGRINSPLEMFPPSHVDSEPIPDVVGVALLGWAIQMNTLRPMRLKYTDYGVHVYYEQR